MNTRRPTIGNTVALDRFNPNGPRGYAAVYNDGEHGPTRSTREEAEADYRIDTDAKKLTPGREHIELGEELELYAVNNGKIYERRHAIERTAQRRYDRLNENPEATGVADAVFQQIRPSVRAWLDTAAHAYAADIPNSSYPKFTDAAKEYAADSIAVSIIQEVQLGNFR